VSAPSSTGTSSPSPISSPPPSPPPPSGSATNSSPPPASPSSCAEALAIILEYSDVDPAVVLLAVAVSGDVSEDEATSADIDKEVEYNPENMVLESCSVVIAAIIKKDTTYVLRLSLL
jgi:hypothetical protein